MCIAIVMYCNVERFPLLLLLQRVLLAYIFTFYWMLFCRILEQLMHMQKGCTTYFMVPQKLGRRINSRKVQYIPNFKVKYVPNFMAFRGKEHIMEMWKSGVEP